MRSNGPVATKELAMTGREWPGGLVASHREWPPTLAIPSDWPKVAVWSAA
jgi:hypothetical protein